jgi:hypothetical protein
MSGKKEGDVSDVLEAGSTLYAVRRSPARPTAKKSGKSAKSSATKHGLGRTLSAKGSKRDTGRRPDQVLGQQYVAESEDMQRVPHVIAEEIFRQLTR